MPLYSAGRAAARSLFDRLVDWWAGLTIDTDDSDER